MGARGTEVLAVGWRLLLPAAIGLAGALQAAPASGLRGVAAEVQPLLTSRLGHTATLLPSGRVVVIGGRSGTLDDGIDQSTAEVYDPVTGEWSLNVVLQDPSAPAGQMGVGRAFHTATLLPSGQVLVAGGAVITSAEVGIVRVELYDPVTGAFEEMTPLECGRTGHTATMLRSGKILFRGGSGPDCGTSAEIYDPACQEWSGSTCTTRGASELCGPGGPCDELPEPMPGDGPVPREGHTATLLPSGQVLFLGGDADKAELYTPGTVAPPGPGTWESFDRVCPERSRTGHTATLLPNGQVVVAGGDDDEDLVELYTPGTAGAPGSFACFNDLADDPFDPSAGDLGRNDHSATLLRSGGVLLVGDSGSSSLTGGPSVSQSAEVVGLGGAGGGAGFVRTAEGPVLTLATTRSHHTATLLPSGDALIVGGADDGGESLASVELIHVLEESWDSNGTRTGVGVSPVHTGGFLAALLPTRQTDSCPGVADPESGQVLIVGGECAGSSACTSSELYDLRAGESQALPRPGLPLRVDGGTITTLASGEILVAGGTAFDAGCNCVEGAATADIFSPFPGGGWRATAGEMTDSRVDSTATLLQSEEVLVVGGRSAAQSAEIFDPECDATGSCPSWARTAGPLHTRRVAGHTATLLPSGRVLVAGGLFTPGAGGSPDVVTSTAELFDPATGEFTPTRSMGEARWYHTATLLPSGKILVTGGDTRSAEIFDPETESWGRTTDLLHERQGHSAVLLPSGEVLVAGGNPDTGGEAEIYDPTTATWTPVESVGVGAPDLRGRHEEGPGGVDFALEGLLLPSGRVGYFQEAGFSVVSPGYLSRLGLGPRPCLTAVTPDPGLPRLDAVFSYGDTLSITGDRLAGGSEAGSGGTSDSPINSPLIQLRSLENARIAWLEEDRTRVAFTPTAADPLQVTELPPIFDPGLYYLTVFTSGIPSESAMVLFECGLEFLDRDGNGAAVEDETVDLETCGSDCSATFSAEALGARTVRWQQCVRGILCIDDGGAEVPCEAPGAIAVPQDLQCSVDPRCVDSAAGEIACTPEATRVPDSWVDIAGADGASYTTPPVAGPEAGTRYRALADSGCKTASSNAATLVVEETTLPEARVLSPDGGERWLLSPPECEEQPQLCNTEPISWEMEDNVRVCQAHVELLWSHDGGVTYGQGPPPADPGAEVLPFKRTLPALPGEPAPGVLPDPPGLCPHPGLTTTGLAYEVPTTFPSGEKGSLYKVRVTVWDTSGNVRSDESDNPFFIVGPDPSVETLILWNSDRMEGHYGAASTGELAAKLQALAAEVSGVVEDLAGATGAALDDLYGDWDGCAGDCPQKANRLLFQCREDGGFPCADDPGSLACEEDGLPPATLDPCRGSAGDRDGIQDRVLELLSIYRASRYLVLVGDDRIIPMARLPDGTATPEGCYPTGEEGSCPHDSSQLSDEASGLGTASTVGRALAAGRYLSDSLLGAKDRLLPGEVDGVPGLEEFGRFVPDLAVGRLVESPTEIVATIDGFLAQGGALDLTDGESEKIVVSAYDFLIDAGLEIGELWAGGLGAGAVDATLVGGTWGESDVAARVGRLRDAISPSPRLGVGGLLGHATHHELGVPGGGNFQIAGLDSTLAGGGGIAELDLSGSVIYGLGCHGGLPVPDTDPAPRSLPQAFLQAGAQAYVANTGYGWGLEDVIGYGERLTQIMTEELTAPRTGTVVVGEAFTEAKRRYFDEAPVWDAYDRKSLLQWTYYGLPMYRLVTGITPASANGPGAAATRGDGAVEPFVGAAPAPADLSPALSYGAVKIHRRASGAGLGAAAGPATRQAPPPPPFVTRLELTFDLSAEGVYDRRNDLDPGTPGCQPATRTRPDGTEVPIGCYYTLNGLVERATGVADQPIQPYFIFDSRLSGTSQHGVLWLGGEYEEEGDWVPAIGELATNGGIFSDHGSTPRQARNKAVSRRSADGPEADDCRQQDDEITSLVVVTGEALKARDAAEEDPYVFERIYRDVDLEAFYYNNTADRGYNCDRQGPEIGPGPFGDPGSERYHDVAGGQISWEVPVADLGVGGVPGAGIWRVVVVYNDGTVDAAGRGRWRPLELEDLEGDGSWTGSVEAPSEPALHKFAYVVQAVDRRGNVRWSSFDAVELPASLEVPDLAEVSEVDPGPAEELVVLKSDSPDPVAAGGLLAYTLTVKNLGEERLVSVQVLDVLPEGTTYVNAGGAGWTCRTVFAPGNVACFRGRLEPGETVPIVLTVVAPSSGGLVTNTVTVTAVGAVTGDLFEAQDLEITAVSLPGPPQAHAGSDREILKNRSVMLGDLPAASGGTPPYFYSWQVDPAAGSALSSHVAPNPVFTGTAAGSYDAELTVTDAIGADSAPASATIVVDGCPEIVDLFGSPGPGNLGDGHFGATVELRIEQVSVLAGELLVLQAGETVALGPGVTVDEGAELIVRLEPLAGCPPG